MPRRGKTSEWTEHHDRVARVLLLRGKDYDDIADELGFTAEYVQNQLEPVGRGNAAREKYSKIPEQLIADRDQRKAARFARDEAGRASGNLTAEFFGDPEPGRRQW
jgi:hypothetical protein